MPDVPLSLARERLADVLALAATAPVTLLREGEPVAVVLDPGRYDALLEAEEELEDLEAFDQVMADDSPTIPWQQVKHDLDLR